MVQEKVPILDLSDGGLHVAALVRALPRPVVAKPDLRNDVHRHYIWAAICHRVLNEEIVRPFLGILGDDIRVALLIKDTRVNDLVLSPSGTRKTLF